MTTGPTEALHDTLDEAAAEPAMQAKLWRYFPGWTMVAIAALAMFMSAPGQSFSVAAFKDPMRKSLGLTETAYSTAYMFATLFSGVCLPFVGRLLDRFGARRVLPVCAVVVATACVGLASTKGLLMLVISFALLRASGQGALTLSANWLVGEWFERRRGLATALVGLGGSFSVITVPIVNSQIIAHLDWQKGWLLLGAVVFITIFPAAILLVRNRPEDIGLHPDGDDPRTAVPDTVKIASAATPGASAPQAPVAGHWTARQVLRDATFWKLLAAPATSGMVGTGLIFHQVNLMESRGISAGWAMALLSLQATVGAATALGAGWLTDRLQGRAMLAAAMFMLASASALLWCLPLPLLVILYAVLLGLHGSILRSTGMVVWLTYYGRSHQGAIRGASTAAMIFAAAIGPLPVALARDYLQSYDAALLLFIAIPVISGLLVLSARRSSQTKS